MNPHIRALVKIRKAFMCGDAVCKIYFVVQNKWSQALEYEDALKEFLVFPTALYRYCGTSICEWFK